MSELLDLELTVRVGALDARTADAIEAFVTSAVLARGLGMADALDLARGPHWLAVRLPEYGPSAEMIEVLALQPLPADECGRLGVLLDLAEDSAERLGRPDPLGLEDRRLLGRRIARALALLDEVELRAAS